ncbi:hypothetical protein NliqN6_5722 [Naganishia liquefaciens]|uniref:Oxidoreductase molybdopterin-binding domain-containing protein n=1 Tax=Naganishia liquefaciens TaxID=104408 RepID=A0A8H3YGW8_9TREE|nr:hypothetical protein NliqN6_5722 [Naganishia liquefaciens]
MSDLVTHSKEPLNAEPKPQDLVKNDVTPVNLFYHRNHGPVPRDAEEAFRQGSEGLGSWEVVLEIEDGVLDGASVSKRVTLAQLQDKYETVEEDIALQCAGNRRDLFSHTNPPTEGIPWQESTIANIIWKGCLLRSVLVDLFPRLEEKSDEEWHVIFESSQDCGEDEGGVFGGSIPRKIALDSTVPVLLAWQQDGEQLTLQHGAPLRVVVPGIIGARSIKWLRKIIISRKPSQHHAQQQDYKSIPYPPFKEAPSSEEKAKLMAQTEPMNWSPLQCVITKAKMKVQEVGDGGSEGNEGGAVKILLKGYGLGEKGVPLTEVDIFFLTLPSDQPYNPSLDEELTKQAAAKSGEAKRVKIASAAGKKNWGWNLWEAEVALDDLHAMTGGVTQGQIVAVAKAIDANGREQTRWPDWNLRGVGFDGWSVKLVEA